MRVSLKKIRWSTALYGLLTFLVLMLFVSVGVVYFVPRTSSVVQSFAEKTPFPVVIVGYREAISFRELAENMRAIRRFYENQDFSKVGLRVDFSTDDGKKRLKVREKEVLNKMIEDAVIVNIAKERGIFVSTEMARQGVARKLEEYGNSKEVQANLQRLYGWKLADFEEKVVVPSLYEEKLNESFMKEVDPVSVAKAKIEKATEALRGGTPFSEVVKQFSEGQTADQGGDLGWFALPDLAPELRSPVASQKVGVVGSVIESSLGFHIVLVEEVKKEKDGQLYHIKQIFVRKTTFADWLSEKMKTRSILIVDPQYQFDATTARVEFRDEAWRTYEEELFKKASGDASFFF